MRIGVVGGGFVGLTTAVVFVEHGHDVVLVEIDDAKRARLEAGEVPFHEPGLSDAFRDALRGGLRVAADARAMLDRQVVFLCVGTPSRDDGGIDLRFVDIATRDLGVVLAASHELCTLVVKSTVVPGTADSVVAPLLVAACGRGPEDGLFVANNPEFLKEGAALADARHPDRIVIGAVPGHEGGVDAVEALYAGFVAPRVVTTSRTAEMIKYAANAFLATKISYANQLANLCRDVGVDWYDVVDGIGHDDRIGAKFLAAGAGFGGSCFPKDVKALLAFGRDQGHPLPMLDAVLAQNEVQPREVVRLLADAIGGTDALQGARVALLGLAFKPDTDDVRETRALPIWQALRDAGADVVCHDPRAGDTFRALAPEVALAESAETALDGAIGCILHTDWPEYQDLDPAVFAQRMQRAVVVDGRRTLDPVACAAAGVDYRAIGLG